MSCFDWDVTISSDPVNFHCKPQMFTANNTSNSSSSRSCWQASRLLNHLWLPQCVWSVGTGTVFSSIMNGFYKPKLSTEAASRVGDGYETFPKHVNTVREVSILKSYDENRATHSMGKTLSKSRSMGGDSAVAVALDTVHAQRTNVRMSTASSECSIQLTLNPSIQYLQMGVNANNDSEDEWDETIKSTGFDLESDDEDYNQQQQQQRQPLSNVSNSSKKEVPNSRGSAASSTLTSGVEAGLSGFVGGIDAGMNSMLGWVSFGATASSTPAATTTTTNTSAAATATMTVQQMLHRIRELEEMNSNLIRENNRLRR